MKDSHASSSPIPPGCVLHRGLPPLGDFGFLLIVAKGTDRDYGCGGRRAERQWGNPRTRHYPSLNRNR